MGQVVHAELARVSASHITEFGLKKVVQGGTAVAESVPLFRLVFFRWYSAKPRLARLYHLSHLKNRRNENGEKGLQRQRLKGRENKGNGLAPKIKGWQRYGGSLTDLLYNFTSY